MHVVNKFKRVSGFTLIELVVIVLVVAGVATMLLPALARTNPTPVAFRCINNQRQLMAAWTMYAADYLDRATPNSSGGNAGKILSEPSWVAGWMDYTLSPDNTNINYLINPASVMGAGALLGPYIKVASPFRCPADVYQTTAQAARWPARVRSISMNMFFGFTPSAIFPSYRQWLKLGDVPQPSNFWVFIEEHPDSINDGRLFNNPAAAAWTDLPGSLHNGGACLSYADGRAEIHEWGSNQTKRPVQLFWGGGVMDSLAVTDYQWLMSRMTVSN